MIIGSVFWQAIQRRGKSKVFWKKLVPLRIEESVGLPYGAVCHPYHISNLWKIHTDTHIKATHRRNTHKDDTRPVDIQKLHHKVADPTAVVAPGRCSELLSWHMVDPFPQYPPLNPPPTI
jgi:hypothetical protein